jgi:hypothetical protein
MGNVKFILLGCMIILLLSVGVIKADAYQGLDIRCPAKIVKNGKGGIDITKDSFSRALYLYSRLDDNVKSCQKRENIFEFDAGSENFNFLPVVAKADINAGQINNISKKINFLDVFFVTKADLDNSNVHLKNNGSKTNEEYIIALNDFEKWFVWHSALLDKGRVFIPIYGFLSIPQDDIEAANFYDSWETDRNVWIQKTEQYHHYDFYKILDFQRDINGNGYYLLGEDTIRFRYDSKHKRESGVIGWVEEKFIVLWRSRLYYHPKVRAEYFNAGERNEPITNVFNRSGEINKFYVGANKPYHEFRGLLSNNDIETLDKYYDNFGFPQLYPPGRTEGYTAKVCILGAFSTRILKLVVDAAKNSINAFFLLDGSDSMKPFRDFALYFCRAVKSLPPINFNQYIFYGFVDDKRSKDKIKFEEIENLQSYQFSKERKDNDYKEALVEALNRTIDEIYKLKKQKFINDKQVKCLFIISDAGANDETREAINEITQRIENLHIPLVMFVIPERSRARRDDNISGMTDTPESAYESLEDLISNLSQKNPYVYKKEIFPVDSQTSNFEKKNVELVQRLEKSLNNLLKGKFTSNTDKKLFPNFIPKPLMASIQKWSNNGEKQGIHINNHTIKYISEVDNRNKWEKRIAISKYVLNSYRDAVVSRSPKVDLYDFKKLILINSLVSVKSLDKALAKYEKIKNMLQEECGTSEPEILFYEAIMEGEGDLTSISWTKEFDLSEIEKYFEERNFYLNTVTRNDRQEYIYFLESELFEK